MPQTMHFAMTKKKKKTKPAIDRIERRKGALRNRMTIKIKLKKKMREKSKQYSPCYADRFASIRNEQKPNKSKEIIL